MREPILLERYMPTAIAYFMARAFGYPNPPMLVTFIDVTGCSQRKEVPFQ
jgi:hypothetical protein